VGAFEVKKDKRKIAIVGSGSGWNLLSPKTNLTIYALNDFIKTEKFGVKPDVLFIMDVLDEKPQIVSGFDNLGEVIQRINKMKIPFIAPYKYEEIPLSEPFPINKCVEVFGMPYFSNTICYMIAYALLSGAEEIHIYGVNQVSSHEYTEERGAVEYWIGLANGMGVEVSINGDKSQLMKFKARFGNGREGVLYGYLMPYNEIRDQAIKFGEPIIRRLLGPPKPESRTVRKIKP